MEADRKPFAVKISSYINHHCFYHFGDEGVLFFFGKTISTFRYFFVCFSISPKIKERRLNFRFVMIRKEFLTPF